MSGTLWLGPLSLQGFELPQSIAWGGRQRMAVHRLPGGKRVIDAMGRDDSQIAWQGVFAGPDAAMRARLLDLVRAEGSVWPLSWAGFFYSVVISSFQADFARDNWIPYRIACTVLRDEAEAVVELALSAGLDAIADLATANGFGAIDLSGPTAALGADGAGTAGTAAYSAAGDALRGAATSIDGGIQASGATLLGMPLGSADGLNGASLAAGQLAALTGARGYVQRAQANLLQAGTGDSRN